MLCSAFLGHPEWIQEKGILSICSTCIFASTLQRMQLAKLGPKRYSQECVSPKLLQSSVNFVVKNATTIHFVKETPGESSIILCNWMTSVPNQGLFGPSCDGCETMDLLIDQNRATYFMCFRRVPCIAGISLFSSYQAPTSPIPAGLWLSVM